MAEKKKGTATQPGGNAPGTPAGPGGNAPGTLAENSGKEPTQRERYMSRRKESYPDIREDDEDAYYGQANRDLDELEGYRKSNKELADVFDKTPTLAGMLLAAKDGVNPFVYLVEQGGPDLDIRELINDPDFGEKMSQALTKWQEGQLKHKKDQEEMKSNYQASFAALKEIQQERGLSDEDCMALVEKFFGNDEDDGIIGKASRGIVSKETWEAVLKSQNYDSDIASAREQAGAQAMNERIQNPLKKFDDTGMPPSLSSGGAVAGEPKPRKKSRFFDDWEREEGM